ncbi:MAG TPA: hypothetical protein ENI23_05160 [bacterium]|nr:hypothetical protein [bacterium]
MRKLFLNKKLTLVVLGIAVVVIIVVILMSGGGEDVGVYDEETNIYRVNESDGIDRNILDSIEKDIQRETGVDDPATSNEIVTDIPGIFLGTSDAEKEKIEEYERKLEEETDENSKAGLDEDAVDEGGN